MLDAPGPAPLSSGVGLLSLIPFDQPQKVPPRNFYACRSWLPQYMVGEDYRAIMLYQHGIASRFLIRPFKREHVGDSLAEIGRAHV